MVPFNIKKVLKYISALLIFLIPVCLTAQNPFDLKHRVDQSSDTLEVFSDSLPFKDTTQLLPPTAKGHEMGDEVIGFDLEEFQQQAEESQQKEESIADRSDTDETTFPKEDPLSKPTLTRDKEDTSNLLLFIFLLSTIFLALIIAVDRSILNKLYRSLINDNFLSFFMREQKGGTSLQLFFLHIFFIINLALLGYFLIHKVLLWDFDLKLWQCILFVGGVYLLRHLSMNYLKLFVNAQKEISRFYFTIIIFNIFFGLLVFPLNAFAAFAPEIISTTAIYISIFFLIFIYLARQLRGLFIGSKFLNDHQFHFFIYLCTVEIAPLLILGKFFTTIS